MRWPPRSSHVALVAAVIALCMATFLGNMVTEVVKVQLAFSEACFRSAVSAWSPDELATFRWHFAPDFAFLVAYALAGYLYFVERPGRRIVRLPSGVAPQLAPAAAAFDAVENALQLALTHDPAASMPGAFYFAAGTASAMKWLLVVAWACVAFIPFRSEDSDA